MEISTASQQIQASTAVLTLTSQEEEIDTLLHASDLRLDFGTARVEA